MNLEECKINNTNEVDKESTPSQSSTPQEEAEKEAKQLKLDLIEIDKLYHYRSFKNKEDYVKAYSEESNWISEEEVERIIASRKEAITIKNKKLIKETLKDFTIHNLTLQPIENTKLTSIQGVCYNKNIGKTMETSLLLEIYKEVKCLKSDMISVKKNMVTKKELEAVKKNMATKKELAALKKNMATKKDLAKVKKELKKEISDVRTDLANTKIKNHLI